MNLPETAPTRKPRPGNNVYRGCRTERAGWKPRARSPQQLAADIAASIRQPRAAGDSRFTTPHEFTPNAQTQALVHQLLATDLQR